MMIDDLTPAERRVWDAFPRGASVDFRTSGDEDVTRGGGWGPERTVRASVLRALLLTGAQEDGEIAALRLTGARITGVLHLMYAAVGTPVRLSHCHFDATPLLYGAQFRQLNLRASVLPGLDAGALHVEGVLRMSDCRVRGPVGLSGLKITRALFLERAEFRARDAAEPVLQLNHAEIGDGLLAQGIRAHGRVRLDGASIAGVADLTDAELRALSGTALDATGLTVGADLRARGLRTEGGIDLRGARIPGRLDLMGARLSHPGGTALRVSSSVISELWLYLGDRVEGDLVMRRAHIDLLNMTPEKLPEKVLLNNLTYTTLAPHEPAERRLPMLAGGDRYEPYAYEQLTAAYRRIGDDDAARLVQLAKQRRRRATLPWYGRLWGHVQDVTVGYGFRLLRAAVWLLSLLAVGSVAYGLDHPRPLKADEAPGFNPVFYTLDLLLPVIDFGQERAFAPGGWHQWLSYALVVTGWILATATVAGVTRAVSRQ